MKDYQLTRHNLEEVFNELQAMLDDKPVIVLSAQDGNTGKWGMARLWRSWMATTAKFQAANGVTMPLMISSKGNYYGTRPFNQNDAHELFTTQWLGTGADGLRLSWAKQARDGMRPATKGERYCAMIQHDHWCVERGIQLLKPKGSEYEELQKSQDK